VEKAWREDKGGKLLSAKTAELVKKLDAGGSMAAIGAAEGNLAVKHSDDVRRGASSGLALNVVTQIFNVGVHRAGSVASEDGGRMVFQAVSSTPPAFDPEAPH